MKKMRRGERSSGRLSGEALGELLMNLGFVEGFSDEDELTGAGFVFHPQTIPEDSEPIVDAVKDGAPRVAFDGEEAFAPEDLFIFGEFLDKKLKFFYVEGLGEFEGEGLDIVMMPSLEFVEELWINGEFLIDIESVHVEEFLEIYLGVVGAEDLGTGVEFCEFLFEFLEVGFVH